MSVFTEEDVVAVAAGGNVAHNEKFMARYLTTDCTLPTGSDIGKLREFMKRKYVEKKWFCEEKRLNNYTIPSSSYVSSTVSEKDPWGAMRNTSMKSEMTIKTSVKVLSAHLFIQQ